MERTPDAVGLAGPRDLADWLLAHGRHSVTTHEAAQLLGIPETHVSPSLARWQRHGRLFSPTRGLYIAIPPEFRLWGSPPATHFIDTMMRHLDHPYYVCLLSAAEQHGFAHQRPQIFQVMTTVQLRDRAFGRVRLAFYTSTHLLERPTVEVNTPTGTMRVSTIETTVLDLVARSDQAGTLYNVGTILAEMLDDHALDIAALAHVAAHYPTAVVQRAGRLLDVAASNMGLQVDTEALRELIVGASPVLLDTTGDRSGHHDDRWNVIANADYELES